MTLVFFKQSDWFAICDYWTIFISWEVDILRSETKAGVGSRFWVATEKEILQMLTFLECVVLLPSLYVIIVNTLFPSIVVNSGF